MTATPFSPDELVDLRANIDGGRNICPDDVMRLLATLDDAREHLRDTLVNAAKMGKDWADAHAKAEQLRGLAATVVGGLENQAPQGHRCEHEWCRAVRALRAEVDPTAKPCG